MTTTLVGLLSTNYLLEYRGMGAAGGRPALMVEAHRADGSLAARFWLDKGTMLPLRRQVFDSDSHLLSEVEQLCDRVAILQRGRLVREGTIADLTAQRNLYVLGLAEGEAFPVADVRAAGYEVVSGKLENRDAMPESE